MVQYAVEAQRPGSPRSIPIRVRCTRALKIKKLQLVGFKTFADKTEIEVGDGITAVVGPNGSGKSNIADAVLWVLGEQNPRLLRGSDSRDVIFAGTDRRKPLGMAEVRLTVDNSDRSLPLDFHEITVARRVYRSGESQYLLNGAPCRLKDVVELFLDTGVGRGAYSFVTQNEIDAVLSARPEDRRELFEEAAGIKKYRVKKREAVRKLEQAEANLTRIRDILHELEAQREPLAVQAEQARRYLQLTERLREIEIDLLIADVQRADYELYSARRDRDLDMEAIARFDAELARLERESEAIGERLAQAERETDSAAISHQGALTAVERTESQLKLMEERGHAAEQRAEALDAEIGELVHRIAALERTLESADRTVECTEREEGSVGQRLEAARSRLAGLEEALAEASRQADDRQGALLRLAEQRAQRQAALAACRSRMAETAERRAGAVQTADEAAGRLAEAVRRLESVRAEAARLAGEVREEGERRAVLERERAGLLDARSRAATELDSARRLLAERSSRLATLRELQESGEGFHQGLRAVLGAARSGRLSGRYVPVVDLLTVEEAHRVAVEVALGSSLQDIVCDTEAEAREAIEWLKANRAGRATFLAPPLLRPAPRLAGSAVQGLPGLLGVGADLVRAEARFRPVLDLLLGRVVLAEEMDSALRASRRLEGWSRIVTLQGELLAPSGALTGGSLPGRGVHLVGRKGEIDDLSHVLPEIRARVEAQEAALAQAEASLARVESRLAESLSLLSDLQARAASVARDAAAAERDLERIAAEEAGARAEAARLAAVLEALGEEAGRWQESLEAASAEDSSADEAIARARDEAAHLESARDAARREAVALEVEAGRLAEKRASARREREAVGRSLAEARRALAARESQRQTAGALFADSDEARRELEHRLGEARAHLSRCEEHLAVWRARRQELLQESFDKSAAIKEATRRRADTLQELHAAELQIARLEVRLSQASQRLLEEYGIGPEEALARPAAQEMDRSTVSEVARLRREIRQMGAVNTGAVEEHQRLTERHEFLSGQRADLEAARESLLATIAEIDDSTRGTFMGTFEAVSREFGRIFARLFGGGTTRLVLTAPEDLLETGIEVIAQPPGKKPQHLSLLSGGERALTAVALLFSFLAVKPSPFVLLDEVDAPLDGANVEKFVDLVREFAEQTQFLIITHNPTTMESAPRWHGVTMPEPGISRVLSYRVPQESAPSDHAQAVAVAEPQARASGPAGSSEHSKAVATAVA